MCIQVGMLSFELEFDAGNFSERHIHRLRNFPLTAPSDPSRAC